MGGDFYDAMALPNGMVGLVIGDVAGHGVEAAAQTALVTTTLRAFANEDPTSPGRVLARVNRSLTLDHTFNGFVSLFYGVFDPDSTTLRFSNAGHEPPILIRADADCEPLGSTGLVIGVDVGAAYTERTVQLNEGDCLIMLTDGITEARSQATGQMFGWEGAANTAKNVRKTIRSLARGSADARVAEIDLAEAIYREALRFAGADGDAGQGLSDDVALLTVVVHAQSDSSRNGGSVGDSRTGHEIDLLVVADRAEPGVPLATT